jgi:hypothetical protein
MMITDAQLRAQFDRAVANWWWIRLAEDAFELPPFLLFALGSRETNLRNINGDGGHGRGIWQRDDRSFTIPADYLQTPLRQASDAAALLAGHLGHFRDAYPTAIHRAAVCAYNAGRGGVTRAVQAGQKPDSVTTGGNYGADVLERWSFMTRWGWDLL